MFTSVAVEEVEVEADDVDARAALATKRMHWHLRRVYHLAVQVRGGVGKANP
jgi:predicted transposase YbfD/YdcC